MSWIAAFLGFTLLKAWVFSVDRENTDPAVYLTAISKLHLMIWQVVYNIYENDFKGLLSTSIILIKILW